MDKEEAEEAGCLIIEVFDSKGNLVEQYFGPSTLELLVLHRAGECSPTCSWCHELLAKKIGEEAAQSVMHERCFGAPLPSLH